MQIEFIPKSKFSVFSTFLFLSFLFLNLIEANSQQNLAEKLGYAKDAKLLIIHADDLGVSHSENLASIKAIDSGTVNSASVMMPTPWVKEIAEYAKLNKDKHDLGLHLVLTSEWKNYRWGSVASKDKVSTLIDKEGYFFPECPKEPNFEHIETELRAQIDLAYKMGINPTHIDSHMGCLFWKHKEIFKIYVKLAQEYKLPCFVDKSMAASFADENEFIQLIENNKSAVLVDYNFTILPDEYKKGTEAYYIDKLKTMKPGLTQFLIHTAYDNEEMKGITIDHPEWGATWRQDDFDFFMSTTCKEILKEENIVLVTWREISKALKI